jgi:hypothetical protein
MLVVMLSSVNNQLNFGGMSEMFLILFFLFGLFNFIVASLCLRISTGCRLICHLVL